MDIFDEIKSILVEMLDLEDREITPESYLIRDLGAESIDLLELAGALQTRFSVKVEEADIFLQGARGSLQREEFPFLTAERLSAIETGLTDGPPVKVKDLVSYVAWQLGKVGPPLPLLNQGGEL